VYDAGKVKAAQRALVEFRRYLALLVGGSLLLLVLALAISPQRRRTLLQLGVWLVLAAVAVTASVRAVRRQLLGQLPEGTYRDAVGNAVAIVTRVLRERGTQVIWLGAILAVLMYLVGPGRGAVWLRHGLAVGARFVGRWLRHAFRWVAARGPAWTGNHLDLVRIAGVVVAVALALVFSSWTALLWIVIVLAAFEVVVTLVGRAALRNARLPGGPGTGGDAGLAAT
jgi:hypothetical protein